MTTFDDRAAIDDIIANEGFYHGDCDNTLGDNPRCVKIVEYTTRWNAPAWGCVLATDRDPDRYERPTEYVQAPRVIWRFIEAPCVHHLVGVNPITESRVARLRLHLSERELRAVLGLSPDRELIGNFLVEAEFLERLRARGLGLDFRLRYYIETEPPAAEDGAPR